MTLDDLSGKKIGVLGFGQEGQATVRYLLKHGVKPVLFDQRTELAGLPEGIETVLGSDYLTRLDQIEIAFRSPGIWRHSPELLAAEKKGLVITSQIKWFMEQYHNQVIGITGTKGKGTTTALIAHLTTKGLATTVYLTGNIGKIQPLDIFDDIQPTDLVVYEMSSFQLQDLTVSPKIGVILMTTTEHLDHHASISEYREAKQAIAAFQQPGDTIIINEDFPASVVIGKLSNGRKLWFSRNHKVKVGSYINQTEIVITALPEIMEQSFRFPASLIPLRGSHNQENVMAACLAALAAGVKPETLAAVIPMFQGLPHRLQQLPAQDGIEFFDDSFSTVPENAIAAIDAFEEPLTLILGGSDKGASFDELAQHIVERGNVEKIILIGTVMAPKIREALEQYDYPGIILDGFLNLGPAMRALKKTTVSGDVILLSPGCASFDSYHNYVERGNHFQKLAAGWNQL